LLVSNRLDLKDILPYLKDHHEIAFMSANVKTWLEREKKESKTIRDENEHILSAVIRNMNKFVSTVNQQTYEDISYTSKCSKEGCVKTSPSGNSILHTSDVLDTCYVFPCGHLFHMHCLIKIMREHLSHKCNHCYEVQLKQEDENTRKEEKTKAFTPLVVDITEANEKLAMQMKHAEAIKAAAAEAELEGSTENAKQSCHSELEHYLSKVEKIEQRIQLLKKERIEKNTFFRAYDAMKDVSFIAENIKLLLKQVKYRDKIAHVIKRSCPKCTHIAIPRILTPLITDSTLDFDM